MHVRRHSGFSAAILLTAAIVSGQAGTQEPVDGRPLFADDTPIALRISAPFRALMRINQREEHAGSVELTAAEGDAALDIEIRVRGQSRLVGCDFPPLSLEFASDSVAGTVFAGQDRLKLVTLCKDTDSYRDYLALEYLIYRFFNRLTDRSFRVRWVEVEYVFTDVRRPRSVVESAFLIEHDEEAAERLGLQAIERDSLSKADLDPAHTALVTLFHYMIGNTDFSVLEAHGDEPCCHNGKVIGAEGEALIVLPYDFDQAGLINAEYAAPSESLPIQFVTQRHYRGFCIFNPYIEAALARLNEVRSDVARELLESSLREKSIERAMKFFDRSFEIINDAERLQDQVYERCRD